MDTDDVDAVGWLDNADDATAAVDDAYGGGWGNGGCILAPCVM